MSGCQPEQVTGYVDGALDETARAEMDAHLAACDHCREQAESERTLRSRLLGLLHPPLPDGLDGNVRKGLVPVRRISLGRLLIPVAAMAAPLVISLRGTTRFVAWEMARDHDHCFSRESLPSQIASDDAETVMRWFEERGTRVPVLPTEVQGLELVGARYCRLLDLSRSVHVYYRRAQKGPLSVFVLERGLGSREAVRLHTRDHVVQMVRVADRTLGIVTDRDEDIDAFARAFATTEAELAPEGGTRRAANGP